MMRIRRADQRGHADRGWLDSRHTFSFGDYNDPAEMGWGVLRVINEDRVQPGEGFGTHGHRDMEIISYVLEGALEHRDSLGNGAVIQPDEVQRMSAGRGVTHSEFNASREAVVHFLQIWLLPREIGIPPGYEQKCFPPEEKRNRLRLVASGDGRDGSVTMNQEADLYASLLDPGQRVSHRPAAGRLAYVHVARGLVRVNGQSLSAGDGARISDEAEIGIEAETASEVLLFDLPPADRPDEAS